MKEGCVSKSAIRIATTKLGKQLSGYILLRYDMKYASRVFALAAKRGVRSAEERESSRPSAEERVRAFQALDPILRAGAAIGQLDEDRRSESEVEKSALFEAGIVTYGRCFGSGLRTLLSKGIFTGSLSNNKRLHDAIISIRNKHIAHSELRMEQSIIGFQLVEDPNYGKRPNMVLSGLAMRRHYPSDDRLVELEAHCRAIVENAIEPKLLEIGRALREQLLQMPSQQIEQLPEFGGVRPNLEELL